MDLMLERLDRIEAKVDRLINGPVPEIIGPAEAMPLTGCKSLRAMHRWFQQHHVIAYQKGKYRRQAIINKVVSLSLISNAK